MIIVIGGGPAGRMAALRLAGAGKQVTVLEKRALGGQCVHDGCMLVCGLNDVARAIKNTRFLKERGLVDAEVSVRYSNLIKELENTQSKLAHILEKETKEAGVSIEYGAEAELRDGKLFVNGKPRDAEKIIIATGGTLNIPDIEGTQLEGVYTAKTIKTMKDLPKRLAIIGGGVVAAEFAYIYSAFGVEVTVLARSKLLSVLPDAFRGEILRDLADVEIFENANVERIIGTDKVTGVAFDGNAIACDAVLIAAGINPVSEYITGVEKNPDGSIKVDENMETSVKGIYAAGDVVGAPYFTPVARLRGFAAADAILGNPRKVDLSQFPFTVVLGLDYTFCPANESGVTYSSYNIAGPGSFWHVSNSSVGSMHLTADDKSGKILGFASSGPSTSVVGTYLGYLVRRGVSVHDFSQLLEVHPMSDGLYSMIRFVSEELDSKK